MRHVEFGRKGGANNNFYQMMIDCKTSISWISAFSIQWILNKEQGIIECYSYVAYLAPFSIVRLALLE